jgi:hypothetical protein
MAGGGTLLLINQLEDELAQMYDHHAVLNNRINTQELLMTTYSPIQYINLAQAMMVGNGFRAHKATRILFTMENHLQWLLSLSDDLDTDMQTISEAINVLRHRYCAQWGCSGDGSCTVCFRDFTSDGE